MLAVTFLPHYRQTQLFLLHPSASETFLMKSYLQLSPHQQQCYRGSGVVSLQTFKLQEALLPLQPSTDSLDDSL